MVDDEKRTIDLHFASTKEDIPSVGETSPLSSGSASGGLRLLFDSISPTAACVLDTSVMNCDWRTAQENSGLPSDLDAKNTNIETLFSMAISHLPALFSCCALKCSMGGAPEVLAGILQQLLSLSSDDLPLHCEV